MKGPVKGAVLQLFKGLSGVWALVDAQPHSWDPIPGRTSRGLELTGISKGPLEIFSPPYYVCLKPHLRLRAFLM